MKTPKERQYSDLLAVESRVGRRQLGVMMNQVWEEDPRRLAFVLARYKFVSKMLSGQDEVLEVGCGDGFPAHVVAQTVKRLSLSDFDPFFVEEAKRNSQGRENIVDIFQHDLILSQFANKYDAIYLLDVLEHISPDVEKEFLGNLSKSLKPHGLAVIGIPSKESQVYASRQSREGHVNCKTGDDFDQLMRRFFEHVFIFSMNDEVVHTGFNKMAHYLIALCVVPRISLGEVEV